MAISHAKSNQSSSGAKYKQYRKKKQFELGRSATLTGLNETRRKKMRTMGNNSKQVLLAADTANVLDPKTKKSVQAKIKTILENEANRHYVRRNIMTKGTIIETEKGKARITSRPGQHGMINAVLIE